MSHRWQLQGNAGRSANQRLALTRGSRLYDFMLGAQAAGAQVEPFGFTIYNNPCRVDIGHPVAVGMALGMAHVVPELECFPT